MAALPPMSLLERHGRRCLSTIYFLTDTDRQPYIVTALWPPIHISVSISRLVEHLSLGYHTNWNPLAQSLCMCCKRDDITGNGPAGRLFRFY